MSAACRASPAIEQDEDEPPFHADWEAHVFALNRALLGAGIYNLDEFRDAVERIPPQEYLAAVVLREVVPGDHDAAGREGRAHRAGALLVPDARSRQATWCGPPRRLRRTTPGCRATRAARSARSWRSTGRYPLPDNRARQLPAEPEPVYTVRFAARDLFGTGEPPVTVALWHSYLRPAAQPGDRDEGAQMSGDHSGPGATIAAPRSGTWRALLEERGLVDAGSLDRDLASYLIRASPANGARVVARAWLDPGFRERLLADANAALPELGLSMGGGLQEQRLKVVENTAAEHNVIVCTLCSCYPIALLGPSPTWYKSEAYRSAVVRDPRAVLREFGFEIPAQVTISVWDASAESRYMVLPRRPDGTDDTRRAGTGRPRDPQRPDRRRSGLSRDFAGTTWVAHQASLPCTVSNASTSTRLAWALM